MWFIKRRHPLSIIAIGTALGVMTAIGPDNAIHGLAGALMATIFLSLFELYGAPNR